MTFSKGFLFFFRTVFSSGQGLRITWKHLFRSLFHSRSIHDIRSSEYFQSKNAGISVLTYPYEAIPVPEVGRYQLHNEIEDCIVCDKCAKICPVDCIEIEAIKSPVEFGKTSDGTSKRLYAAKFDIDMAKCCYCGLCTTVCPTECLTMSDEYDYSVFDLSKLKFGFGNLSEAETEKKRMEWEKHQESKNTSAAKENTAAPARLRPTITTANPSEASQKEQESKLESKNITEDKQPDTHSKQDQSMSRPLRSRPVMISPSLETPAENPTPETPIADKEKPKRPLFKSPPKTQQNDEG